MSKIFIADRQHAALFLATVAGGYKPPARGCETGQGRLVKRRDSLATGFNRFCMD